MALPKEFRLAKRTDFEGFKTNSLSFSSRFVRLKVSRRADSESKFAFAVPKRVGSAVKRIRIRRILSEWVRINIETFPRGFNWMVIVVGVPESKSALSATLREEIAALSLRAKNEL